MNWLCIQSASVRYFLVVFGTAAAIHLLAPSINPFPANVTFASGDIEADLDSDDIEIKKIDKGKYKRRHTRVFEFLLTNQEEKARERLAKWFAADPSDPENYYTLAVIESRAGNVPGALAAMRQALELGIAPERFVAGTHTMLDPIRDTPEFKKLVDSFANRVVSGPMLADMTDHNVKVWVRTAGPAEVQVVVTPASDGGKSVESDKVRSSTESDCTAVVPVDGLEPNREYRYRVLVDSVEDASRAQFQSFTTSPVPGSPTKFSIAFGGCAGYTPSNEHMWDTIRSYHPRAMWFLGDNEYIDQPEMPALQYYCFYRRQARPEFRRMVAGTPVYAIWDDHDFGTNDGNGGPEIESPAWKRKVWNVFRQTWVNPAYGGGEKQPGCWFDYQFGDVHFIFLDGRYYRSTSKEGVDPPTMLGPVQKKWLLETLGNSRAKFKVLISPVAWFLETKGESPDTWNGFRQERREIFNFLSDNKIEGVVLVSSDRHRSDLLKNERPNGYTLHEFNSGLLTNDSVHPTLPAAEFSYNEHPCFGLLSFDTTVPDATVTYRIIDLNGKEHLKYTVLRSELR